MAPKQTEREKKAFAASLETGRAAADAMRRMRQLHGAIDIEVPLPVQWNCVFLVVPSGPVDGAARVAARR